MTAAEIAALFAIVALAACGSGVDVSILDADVERDGRADAADGGAGSDADPDGGVSCLDQCTPPDASPGTLPAGADCDPLLDQCAAGLTCRLWIDGGYCAPVGPLEAGADCTDDGVDACGHAMACIGSGFHFCRVICDRTAPFARCPGGTCEEFPSAPPDIGFCLE